MRSCWDRTRVLSRGLAFSSSVNHIRIIFYLIKFNIFFWLTREAIGFALFCFVLLTCSRICVCMCMRLHTHAHACACICMHTHVYACSRIACELISLHFVSFSPLTTLNWLIIFFIFYFCYVISLLSRVLAVSLQNQKQENEVLGWIEKSCWQKMERLESFFRVF